MANLSLQYKSGSKFSQVILYSSLEQFEFSQKKQREQPVQDNSKAWRLVDLDTGEIVDSYTPTPPPKRPKPICSYKNSWAATVNAPKKLTPFQGHPTFFQENLRMLRGRVLRRSGSTPEEVKRVNALSENELLCILNRMLGFA